LHPLTFSVFVVNNFRIPGTADLIAYLEQIPACLTQLPRLPDGLASYQVIVVDPFHIKANELHRLQQFAAQVEAAWGLHPRSQETEVQHASSGLFKKMLVLNVKSVCCYQITPTDMECACQMLSM
jgi:hypothetical protein